MNRDRAVYKLTRYRYVVAKWRVIKVAISFRTLRDRRARGKEISRPLFLRIPGDRSMKRSFSRYIVSNSGEKKRGGEEELAQFRGWPTFRDFRANFVRPISLVSPVIVRNFEKRNDILIRITRPRKKKKKFKTFSHRTRNNF